MAEHTAPGTLRSPAPDWLGLGWMALAMAALALNLGSYALIDPDEGRTAAAALEMASTGDFLLPRLNGLPHLDKPVLLYAATAASIHLLGATELAARLPSLLFAWATVGLTAWFSARLFGRRTAWIAGTACATAPLTMVYARTAIFDSMLTFFVVLALVSFYLACEFDGDSRRPRAHRAWTLLAWLGMALGTLTKGPVALALPLMVAAPFALWRRRSSRVWHPAGLLAYVAVVLPWTVVVEHRQPGFLRYTLLTESWRRFTTDQMDRTGPLWYFLPVLLAGAFPWLLAALAAVRARRREARERLRDPRLVFLALWVVLPLLFFTVSQSKRPHYVLPLVPALALLAAQSLGGTDPPLRPVRAGALGWLVSGILLLVAGTTRVASTAGVDPALASSIRWTAAALGALALTAAALSWAGARHRLAAGIALSLPLVLLPLVTAPLLERIADARSARGLGAALRPHLTTESAVVAVDSFSPSLVFYLGRSILVSDASPGRLGSNYISSRPRDWTADGSTLRPAGWWQREAAACPRPTFFVIERPFEPQRAALAAAGLPLLYDDGELAALGPCVPRAPAPAALRPAATPTRSADLDPGPQWARLGR